METVATLTCSWEICGKKLREFCTICPQTERLFCDDTCKERDEQERTPPPSSIH
jgi:hypothetical protein